MNIDSIGKSLQIISPVITGSGDGTRKDGFQTREQLQSHKIRALAYPAVADETVN
jgi:hypothetical protein